MENENNLPFEVERKWEKDFYSMPNAFLNGYCKYVGWQGHIVYSALWRHADKNTKDCYPGIKHLAEELGVGITSVKLGIKRLKELNIISVLRRGKTQSNIYYLEDKKSWKIIQGQKWSNKKKEKKSDGRGATISDGRNTTE